MRNLLANPGVGLIFLIPSVRETLRVNGTATIHDEPALLACCANQGRLPLTVTRVAVAEVFLHCAKAFLRSKLWQPETWPATRPVPPMRSEEHTSELQSLMRNSYAVFCLKKKNYKQI